MEYHFSSKWLNVFANKGWYFASRKTIPFCQGNRQPDAVTIVATTENNFLVVIRQWRQSIGGFAYELPAGLIDDGETVEQAAIREFKEETGWNLKIDNVLPQAFSSVGLTDESHAIVIGKAHNKGLHRHTLGPQIDGDTSDSNIRVEYWDTKSIFDLMENKNVDAKLAMLSILL